jgi:hypothetical protein
MFKLLIASVQVIWDILMCWDHLLKELVMMMISNIGWLGGDLGYVLMQGFTVAAFNKLIACSTFLVLITCWAYVFFPVAGYLSWADPPPPLTGRNRWKTTLTKRVDLSRNFCQKVYSQKHLYSMIIKTLAGLRPLFKRVEDRWCEKHNCKCSWQVNIFYQKR